MTVRLLHVSDTHLGKKQYRSETRQNDYLDAFSETIDIAIDREVDAIIHTGDLFDDSSPSVPVITQTIDVLSRLETARIPLYGIVGNHERKRDTQWLDLIERFESIHRLGTDPVVFGDGTVAVYGIDAVRKPMWDTTDFTLRETSAQAKLVCMHELVSPPVPGHMADYDTRDVLHRFGCDIDGLALGDYHEDVSTTVDGTPVWYAGSTEKTSRSESPDHSVVEVTITSSGELSREKVYLQSPRTFTEMNIIIGRNTDLAEVRETIEQYDVTGSNEKSVVAIVELAGRDAGITTSDVQRIISEYDIEVSHVIDERIEFSSEIDIDDDPTTVSDADISAVLDDAITDLHVPPAVQDVESLIRDEELPDSHVRDSVEETITEYLHE